MTIKTAQRLGSIQEYYFSKKLREIAQMRDAGIDIINLGIGSPDLQPHPDVIDTLTTAVGQEDSHGYQSYRGIPQLREAISDWYLKMFDVQLDMDTEVLPLIGSKEGIMHIAMTYLEEGDEVLVPDPGYPTYEAACRLTGATVVKYKLTEDQKWLPDLKNLADRDLSKTKMMWINYPHMPTGATPTTKIFEELVAFAQNNQILLCHDNPYAFILNPNPKSILSIHGAKDVVIELNSLSKTFNMAGWRVGFMASNLHRINDVLRFKTNMDSGMFRPIQSAAAKALSLPDAWYHEVNQQYEARRVVAIKIMKKLGCQFNTNQSGLFIWGRIPKSYRSAKQVSDLLLDHARVFITPGDIFGEMGSRYMRISLCSPMEVLEEALSRISIAIPKIKVDPK